MARARPPMGDVLGGTANRSRSRRHRHYYERWGRVEPAMG